MKKQDQKQKINLDTRLIIKINNHTIESFKLPFLGSQICKISQPVKQ